VTCTQAGADTVATLGGGQPQMPMPEGKADAVIGVDTHRDSHAAAILDRDGGPVAELTVTSDQAGSEALLGLSPSGRRGRRWWAGRGPAATAPGWPAS
jgi:transposase